MPDALFRRIQQHDYMIQAIDYGEIEVNGETYYSDVLVWWDGRVEYKEKKHIFSMEDFLKMAEKKPKVIILGVGLEGSMRVPEKVQELAEQINIELFVEKSARAVQMFNAFHSEGKRVAAYIHVSM